MPFRAMGVSCAVEALKFIAVVDFVSPTRVSHFSTRAHSPLLTHTVRSSPQICRWPSPSLPDLQACRKAAAQIFWSTRPSAIATSALAHDGSGPGRIFPSATCPQPRIAVRSDEPRGIEGFQRGLAVASSFSQRQVGRRRSEGGGCSVGCRQPAQAAGPSLGSRLAT